MIKETRENEERKKEKEAHRGAENAPGKRVRVESGRKIRQL
jgi:hypothetical protein